MDPEIGPTFKKYEKETLDYAVKNFGAQARNPKAIEIAFQQVKAAHVEEIAQEIADRKVKEEMGRLRGVAPAKGAAREPLSLESGGTGGRAPAKKQVVVTQGDERKADTRGVLPEVVARARARRAAGR
jgi:hypothetical protein